MVIVKWFNMFEEVDVENEKLYTIVARGHDDFWDILESSNDLAYLVANNTWEGMLIDEDKELHVFVQNNESDYQAIHNLVDALNLYNWKVAGNNPLMMQSYYLSYLKLKRENIERELRDNWETYRSFIYSNN